MDLVLKKLKTLPTQNNLKKTTNQHNYYTMKKFKFLIGLFIISSFLFTACDGGDDDPTVEPPAPKFEVLKSYLVSNNMDLPGILSTSAGKFVAPPPATEDLDAFLATYYIMDIRNGEAFNGGHIQGAHNVAFKDILTEASKAGGKPILIACYTGQTACYATALLRMYGYTDTKALKWGMSGWNETTAGPWNSNTGNIAKNHANWSYESAPVPSTFEYPTISSVKTDGDAILKERIEAVVNAGFKTANGADVLNNPSGYYINNFFSNDHYINFGHIDGAYKIKPLSFTDPDSGDTIKNLDPGAKVVTYCYTGQTSAVITAYLRVLGYDAYSLTFGMNGLFTDNATWGTTVNHWGHDSNPKSLPLIQ